MRTLSLDLRERILFSYDKKAGTREEIANRHRVSLGMVKNSCNSAGGPARFGSRHHRSGRKPMILAAHQRQMGALLGKKPELTLKELRAAVELECSLPAIHYALEKMGLTYKKRRFGPASKIAPTSRGRAPRGKRVHASSPQGHWNTTTIINWFGLSGYSFI